MIGTALVEANPAPASIISGVVDSVISFKKKLEEVLNVALSRFGEIVRELVGLEAPREPAELMELEIQLHQRLGRECIDLVTGTIIEIAHEDEQVLEKAERLASSAELRPQRATETVRVTLMGGSTVTLRTPYFLRRQPKQRKPGRPRKKTRGKEGNGLYPILAVLGIHFRATPALASEVGRLVAQGTLQDAKANLAVRGVHLDIKAIRRLTQRLAKQALAYREWCLSKSVERPMDPSTMKGKRLAIAIDGGRLRIRTPKLGRKRDSGHRGFEAGWREPKVLVVYELDSRGRKKRRGLVRYDGTLEGADKVYQLLASILLQIGAVAAREWVVLGDGAEWIWNRIPDLVNAVGYDLQRVTPILDFYHAVEHLGAIMEEVKGWSEEQRKKWLSQSKRYLRKGNIEALVENARAELCRGRNAGTISKKLAYFWEHRDTMRYADFKKRNLPLGSGVIESGVRRLVNLRLKGAGIFWKFENAEGVLHLRAQLLSGRWKEFIQTIFQPRQFWGMQVGSNSAPLCEA